MVLCPSARRGTRSSRSMSRRRRSARSRRRSTAARRRARASWRASASSVSGPVATIAVAVGQLVDHAALDPDARVDARCARDRAGEAEAIDRERLAGGHASAHRRTPGSSEPARRSSALSRPAGDSTTSDAQRVRADKLARAAASSARRTCASGFDSTERDVDAALGELPGGLAAGKATTDDQHRDPSQGLPSPRPSPADGRGRGASATRPTTPDRAASTRAAPLRRSPRWLRPRRPPSSRTRA